MDQLVHQLVARLDRLDDKIAASHGEGYSVEVNDLLDERLDIQEALNNVGRIILARA